MKNRKLLLLTIGLLVMVMALSGCGKKDDAPVVDKGPEVEGESTDETEDVVESDLDADQFLNVVLAAEPTTLDPSKGSDNYSYTILNNVLEPLTRLEEDEDQKNILRGAGAESWESNDDGTVWTFKIRENTWSDGVAVRAQDYEYGIKRSLDQDTASPSAYLLTPILNARKVNAGELGVDELGVKSLDDNTLEITLEATTPYFEQLTFQRVTMPQRQDIVEANGDKYGSEIDTVIFNGPFVIEEWVHNSEIILAKNDSFWGKDDVHLEKVTLKIIQDENARMNSLSNGSIDVTTANKPEWKDKFEKDDKLDHYEVIGAQTFFKMFNTKDELFKNANVRKAFSIAVDREEIANVIYHGVNTPTYGWVAPNIMIGDKEYRDVVEGPIKKLIEENPDPKALLIKGLEELGMDTDPSKLTVTMTLGGTDQWFRTYGEYCQQMFIKNLGVDFQVEFLDWPVFSDAAARGDFQIGYMAWGAEFNDPVSLLSLLTSDSNSIDTGWENARYDELINLAATEMDNAKRTELFEEAENILLYEDAVLAPTVNPRANTFVYKYVNGLGVTPFGTTGYKSGSTSGR